MENNAKKEVLNLKIKTLTDYTQPNAALTSGDIDTNAFQHYTFLNDWNKSHKSNIVPVGGTILVAGRLYSDKHKSIKDIPENGTVGISNSKVTQGRSLLILQSAGLIKIASNVKDPTVKDIVENKNNLKFKELATDQLVRTLQRQMLPPLTLALSSDLVDQSSQPYMCSQQIKIPTGELILLPQQKIRKIALRLKNLSKPTNLIMWPIILITKVAPEKLRFGRAHQRYNKIKICLTQRVESLY